MTAEATEAIVVDVRELAPRERHPLIFQSFDRLDLGQALRLVNDHDERDLPESDQHKGVAQ